MKNETNVKEYEENELCDLWYTCGNCEITCINEEHKYCPNCGFKINKFIRKEIFMNGMDKDYELRHDEFYLIEKEGICKETYVMKWNKYIKGFLFINKHCQISKLLKQENDWECYNFIKKVET